MRWCWLIAVVALSSPAWAETSVEPVPPGLVPGAPTIRFAHPGPQVMIERAAFALRVEDRQLAGTLTLALSATYSAQDTAFSIDVPAGTRITSLAITTGPRPERLVARPLAADQARVDYRSVVEFRRDPALLQWMGTAEHPDRLELRVFPLGMFSPATVELGIVLPRVTALAIDPDEQLIRHLEVTVQGGAARQRFRDVHEPVTLALARTEAPFAPARRSLVTPATSLFAGVAVPTITVSPPSVVWCSFGGPREIRRMVRDHHAQLRYCYMRVAQRRPSLAGTAELHFHIAEDGKVGAVRIDGDLDDPEVTACLGREVASWQLASVGGAADVTYPLHFQIAAQPDEP